MQPPKKKQQKRGLFGKLAGAVGEAVKGVASLGSKAVKAVGSAFGDAVSAARGMLDSTAGQWVRRAASAMLTVVAPPVGLAMTAANAAYDGVVNGDWSGALASGAALAGGAGLIPGQAVLAAQQGVAVLDAVKRDDPAAAIVGALGGIAGATGDPIMVRAASGARDLARVAGALEAAADGDIGPAVDAIGSHTTRQELARR